MGDKFFCLAPEKGKGDSPLTHGREFREKRRRRYCKKTTIYRPLNLNLNLCQDILFFLAQTRHPIRRLLHHLFSFPQKRICLVPNPITRIRIPKKRPSSSSRYLPTKKGIFPSSPLTITQVALSHTGKKKRRKETCAMISPNVFCPPHQKRGKETSILFFFEAPLTFSHIIGRGEIMNGPPEKHRQRSFHFFSSPPPELITKRLRKVGRPLWVRPPPPKLKNPLCLRTLLV